MNLTLTDNENDKTYQKIIQKIDDKFDTNEGGFIKMNSFNRSLCNQKYYLKEQLKDNKRRDIKIFNFVKKYEKELSNKLKSSTIKMNYFLSDENIKSKNNNNNFFESILLRNQSNKKKKKNKTKSEHKIWNFPTQKIKKDNKDYYSYFFFNFKLKNKKNKNKNKKAESEKITKQQYLKRINQILDEYYHKFYSKKEYLKKMEETKDHKLVSLQLIMGNKDSKLRLKKENSSGKKDDFIKEIIIMKGKSYKEEWTNTYDFNDLNNNNETINTLNTFNTCNTFYNYKKNYIQINSFNEFDKNISNNEIDKKNDRVIKIINNNYIRDLFYKNSENNIFNNNFYNFQNRFRNNRRNIFKEIENKNFVGNYQKNRMIYYNTGRFDMPLVTKLSKNKISN